MKVHACDEQNGHVSHRSLQKKLGMPLAETYPVSVWVHIIDWWPVCIILYLMMMSTNGTGQLLACAQRRSSCKQDEPL